ncbi:MAG: ATP-binding protein [Pseudomonadota bacterium]
MSAIDADRDGRPPVRGGLFRKYLVSFLVVVSAALIANNVIDAIFSYREQQRLLIAVQREQAGAAADKINQFLKEIERQLVWLSQLSLQMLPPEEMRVTGIRLLRLTPAISEIAQLDPQGREQLRVSRYVRDTVRSHTDLSQSPAFVDARARGVYYGPIFFFRETEPYITVAVSGADGGVIIADVNLRFMWDLVSQIKVGNAGNAFVVDTRGRLIAHPDLRLVLKNTDLSGLPQVASALAGSADSDAGSVVTDPAGKRVLSVHTSIVPIGWKVFVELPTHEAYASLYASMLNSALLLLVSLFCAFLAALLLSRRMADPIRALTEGAERIGSGDLDQRLVIRTGDELQTLGEQFNRMAERLRESYLTLEGRVAARTTELAQARDQAIEERAEAHHARQAAELANETKSRFLAVVSHELRTPLNGVMGVLQLLDNSHLDGRQIRLLTAAKVSGDTLLALIESILDYARLEAGADKLELRNFRLDQLIEADLDLLRREAEAKGLTLGLSMRGDVAADVAGDPIKLSRLVLNLLGNAVKFTARGGIQVDLVFDTPDAPGMLHLSVTDTGIGIAPDIQERIFEDFVQADSDIERRFGGTGLGLAISRRLARLMAGDLSVRSELGKGSTFTLSIPLDRAQPVPAVVEVRPPVTKLSVLLVDDDPVNRDVGHALLVRLGHEPVVASSGAVALELVRSGAFDVVLMDVHMPEMDGIATARLIRRLQLDRSPRIIALTADLSDRTQGRLTASGIHARVSKPITLQALQSALQAGVDDQPGTPVGASELTAGSLIDDDFFNDQEELLGVPRLRGLRTIFLDTCLPLTRSMVEAARTGDRHHMQRLAHRIGSAASALGLERLFSQCNGIEADAARLPADALEAVAVQLEATYRESIAALNERLREPERA